ncbi:hypothetical protein TTX_0114 [Thermoproteus tenax Kra 1]|uniref:Uncharacterized protein n=1 Tax=Thermoproteus tenax (strain ATCC 35583 / DSM 2078 / JCM 9277 / NBRC 100435 / Kra 1) TaxID=768679 RepID=G4RMF9_THETK|nr:hypothetical protein TTX_0114 [Thermoproteus tenax Kra 1]
MKIKQIIYDFLFGAFYLDLYKEVAKIHKQLLLVTEFLVFGEFLGIPLLSSYYAMRLLPYFVGELYDFKSEMLKEKDLFEEIAHVDVH